MEDNTLNGMCRCCAAEGIFKDIKSSYTWMGEEEVYGDMLRECFDIKIMTSEYGGICEMCITHLRNSVNFKKQVLNTEKQFKKHVEAQRLKTPIVKEEMSGDENSQGSDHDMDNGEDEDYIPGYHVKIKTESGDEVSARMHKPTKSRSKKSKSSDTDVKRGDNVERRRKRKKKSDVSATPERVEHRVNLTAILQCSNASPFRDKTVRGFSCLYCSEYFPNIQDLRLHTAQQTEKDKLNQIIDYKLSYNPIKVDITDLQCNVCSTPMTDLNHLKEHLVIVHKKTIHKDIKDIILPFRLEDGNNFVCVVCSDRHVSFKNLYHHMSIHYRNYCCNKCGAGYITIAALRKHGNTHAQGIFPCDFCEKTFISLTKKRNHMKGVHTAGWRRNKCPECPEVFASYYDRSEHMVKEHNATPVTFPCNACNKIYKKKFELNRHIRHHHLQHKSFLCDVCNAKFFSKRGLADHLMRHTGGEECSCDICGKTFSRHRTLKEHVKVHEDEKKYQCEICKKTFMQKCGLKSHQRLHQDDLDIFKEFDDVKHLVDNRAMTLKEIAVENKRKAMAEKQKTQYI